MEYIDRCMPRGWGSCRFNCNCLFHLEKQEHENQIIQLKRSVTPNVMELFCILPPFITWYNKHSL